MNFELMTNKEIVKDLGQSYDLLRRTKGIQDKELIARGGTTSDALNKFRSNRGNITVESLVKLLRGIGELHRLETLFSIPDIYSPIRGKSVVPSKRIRKPRRRDSVFKWGDEE